MNEYKEYVIRRLVYLDALINKAELQLKGAPVGSLRIRDNKGCPQFYHFNAGRDPKEVYLRSEDMDTIRSLANKEYNQKMLAGSVKERDAIIAFLKKLGLTDAQITDLRRSEGAADPALPLGMLPEKVYGNMAAAKRQLITPVIMPAETYIQKWIDYEFPHKPFKDDDRTEFYSEKGERMRSKTEVLIANAFYSYDIPYRYECPLRLNNNLIVHPDFTALNKRLLKVFYWEHLGLLSNPDYAEAQVLKLQQYENAGIFPGDPLLITRESANRPLSTHSIKRLIERYLL